MQSIVTEILNSGAPREARGESLDINYASEYVTRRTR